MSYKIGFIGTGVMGGALARAVRKSENSVLLSNVPKSVADDLANELDCAAGDNMTVAKECEYIVLAVKPQIIREVLSEIAPVLKSRTDNYVLITIAAGIAIETVRQETGVYCPVIRLMPNTPVLVGKGVILCVFDGANSSQKEEFFRMFKAAGFCDEINEGDIDAAGALTGCGPAFAYITMNSLASGAAECGIDPEKAKKYAELTLLGAAELAFQSGRDLEELKQAVCSPKGTTVEGVAVLEERKVRSAFADAVRASYKRSLELGKK
ncbi:MAG: pyrroline-5-carboxylate reductase [Clostridia bacterium]|nr:pyrroline-5-carboxylate reductase [Clostridia bacterium]